MAIRRNLVSRLWLLDRFFADYGRLDGIPCNKLDDKFGKVFLLVINFIFSLLFERIDFYMIIKIIKT